MDERRGTRSGRRESGDGRGRHASPSDGAPARASSRTAARAAARRRARSSHPGPTAGRVLRTVLVATLVVALGAGAWVGLTLMRRSRERASATLAVRPSSIAATLTPAPAAGIRIARLRALADAAVFQRPDDAGDGIKIASFLGGETRRFYGIGPVPRRLRIIWKNRIGSGRTKGTASSTGTVTWSGTGWTGQPTLVRQDGRLLVVVGGFDHGLRAIDAADGDTVWRYEFPDVIKGTNTIFPDPARGGKLSVVCGSRRGLDKSLGSADVTPVRCVSLSDGRELWRLGVPRTRSYSRDADGSAIFKDGSLYQGVESGHMYRIDPSRISGSGTSRRPRIEASALLYENGDSARHGGNLVLEGSPVVIGDRLYVEAGSGHIYGLRLPDLKKVWDYRTGSDLDSTAVATRDGFLLCGIEKQYIAGKGGVIKLDPRKPPAEAGVWYLPTGNRRFTDWEGGVIGSVSVNDEYDPDGTRPPLAAVSAIDGYVYLFSQVETKGSAAIFDGKRRLPTPVVVARRSIGGAISTPIIVDDHLIAAGYDAKVHVWRIRYDDPSGVPLKTRDGRTVRVGLKELDTFAAGGFESTPIVWSGRIYIGSRDGFLYCLGE